MGNRIPLWETDFYIKYIVFTFDKWELFIRFTGQIPSYYTLEAQKHHIGEHTTILY